MSVDVGQGDDTNNNSMDDDEGEDPVQPVDENDDDIEEAKGMESMVGHTNTYRDPAQSTDADEDEEDGAADIIDMSENMDEEDGAADISDHFMSEKMGIETESDDDIDAHPKKICEIHGQEPKRNNSDTAKVSPSKRPRKRRRRASTSSKSEDDERNAPETEADNFNLCASLWEAIPFTDIVSTIYVFKNGILFFWQVNVPDINFQNQEHPRFKFQTEIKAFDASGGEHRFTPECHVSGSSLLEVCLSITMEFSSRNVSHSLEHSSITLRPAISMGNLCTWKIPKSPCSTLFPLRSFKGCPRDNFKIDFASRILSLLAWTSLT